MFQNFFKTAIRNILRERYYATIKVAGLALGLGTTLVIYLYVSYQLSYDRFQPDADRTYCVLQTNIWDPKGGVFNSTGPAVAVGLLDEFPEVEEAMRINTPGSQVVRYTKADGTVIAFNEEKVFAADSNFFSFFDFRLKEGDPKTALTGVGKVIISDEVAQKLFGDERALGKIIFISDKKISVEVTGVTTPQPKNTHFNFDYLLSLHTNEAVKNFEWSWIWTQVVTYVKLRPDADVAALSNKIKTFADRGALSTFQTLRMDYAAFAKERGGWHLYLQPLKDIHLQSYKTGNRLGQVGDIRYVYIFSAVGIFILLIAIINFVNLSTARAANRAKEVGVKKTLGILRKSLIIQFQTEYILITFAAMLLGLAAAEILRLIIQPIAGIQIPLTGFTENHAWLLVLLLPIVVGFLAGLYPAFYMTSFQPAQVLKGKSAGGVKSSYFRNALVVFQFSISIILMVATLIVYQQLNLYQNKDIGMDTENLMIVRYADKLGPQLESFREEISNYPGVLNASISNDIREGYEEIFMREGDDTKYSINMFKADENFFETTKMKVVAGRGFDKTRPADKDAVVLTETTCNMLGWKPDEAVGERMSYIGDDVGAMEVIGVVRDVHIQPLRNNISPIIFLNINTGMYRDDRILLVRYSANEFTKVLNMVDARWKQLAESISLSYTFYDETLKRQYSFEQRLGALFLIFTILSITIAVMGLVGLVSYSAEQRKKEIGIRKVFGATLTGIYLMMNKEYVRLMLIALVIATPTAWWLMQQWLSQIPDSNRIEISPFVFVFAFIVELALALICVGYLALRAASLNPSVALKEE
jgi:putative ABC transport system permease protein